MRNKMQGLKTSLQKHFSLTKKDETGIKQVEAEVNDEEVLQKASNVLVRLILLSKKPKLK